MKKNLFLVAAFLVMGFVTAQEKTYFGVKGGLNYSNLSGNDNTKALPGFYAGGFVEFKFLDMLSLQPELVFSAQGAKYDDGVDKFNVNLNYLQVPVMVKLYFLDIIYVEAGPQIGFLMSAKHDSVNTKDFYKSSEIAAGIGAGVNIVEKFRAGVRMNLGLSDINKDSGSGSDATKSVVVQIGGAYIF